MTPRELDPSSVQAKLRLMQDLVDDLRVVGDPDGARLSRSPSTVTSSRPPPIEHRSAIASPTRWRRRPGSSTPRFLINCSSRRGCETCSSTSTQPSTSIASRPPSRLLATSSAGTSARWLRGWLITLPASDGVAAHRRCTAGAGSPPRSAGRRALRRRGGAACAATARAPSCLAVRRGTVDHGRAPVVFEDHER